MIVTLIKSSQIPDKGGNNNNNNNKCISPQRSVIVPESIVYHCLNMPSSSSSLRTLVSHSLPMLLFLNKNIHTQPDTCSNKVSIEKKGSELTESK